MRWRISWRNSARFSSPTASASASSIAAGCRSRTSFTLTSKTASLPARSGAPVIGQEGHVYGAVITCLGANQLILEARNEPSCTELDRDILALAAGEFGVADPADEIDDHHVIFCRCPLDRLGLALRLGHALQCLLDLFLRHLDRQLFEAETAKFRFRHLRQHFQRHRVFEVGAFRRRHDFNLRRQCQPKVLLANSLGRAALQRALQHFTAHGLAVALAQQVERHLAGAESGNADRLPELAETTADLLLELAGRDGDLELALQPFGAGLGYVHRTMLIGKFQLVGLVRAGGFEPPRFSSLEPKSSASANSATPARPPLCGGRH